MNYFFDNFVDKAYSVVDAASKKTGEMVELSKYKMEAIKTNNQIEKLYEQLGKAVYSTIKSSYQNDELVDGITEEIDELLMRLDALNEKISEMKKMTRCPACGAKNQPENYFCSRCGSRLKSEFQDGFYDNSDEFADDDKPSK